MKKFLGVLVGVIVLVLALIYYFRYGRPFGEGVKAGTLNYVVYKGWLWKTYEGEVILAGFQNKVNSSLQSNEFTFSIDNEAVAKRLELASGKEVQLHYYEYVGTLPWRGVSKFIVDSIVSISGPKPLLGQ
jgi:hypothetical protein